MSSPYRVLDFQQIQVQIQVAPLTPESLTEHLKSESARMKKDFDEHKRTGKPVGKVVVINDASCDLMPSPTVRKLQAQWIKDNEALLRMVCHKIAFVIPSNPMRVTLTGVFWLAPVPVPVELHERLELALDWAIAEVDKIGGQVPNTLLMGGVELIERHKIAIGA